MPGELSIPGKATQPSIQDVSGKLEVRDGCVAVRLISGELRLAVVQRGFSLSSDGLEIESGQVGESLPVDAALTNSEGIQLSLGQLLELTSVEGIESCEGVSPSVVVFFDLEGLLGQE